VQRRRSFCGIRSRQPELPAALLCELHCSCEGTNTYSVFLRLVIGFTDVADGRADVERARCKFEWQSPKFRGDVQRDLEEARRRIDDLERRLEKLERT
jgi:hypothetical protein